MSLTSGTRLGPYEVVSAIGEGGMGQVYRARDTTLNRDVAVKVLSAAFATDPERLARFEREAQILAALNHPNIAHIYGLERSPAVSDSRTAAGDGRTSPESRTALIMELVEGEDLSVRMARGRIPAAEALAIAKQIAAALDVAHEHGIIHRDLKPANIKVRDDGVVKVLDFGLAKAVDRGPAADVANSPTLTARRTDVGAVMGTAWYMSPEQARGRPVDKRTDIWAFGVVLFEMLTGRAMFEGETVTDVLAAVVTNDPEWKRLPRATPASTRQLLEQCLEKDKTRRLRDIGDARLLLESTAGATAAPQIKSPRWLVWTSVALAALLIGAIGALINTTSRSTVSQARFDIGTPTGAFLRLDEQPALSISPDGQTVAFTVSEGGTRRIYLRRRVDAESRLLPGSDGAAGPVFSPDGKSVAFTTAAEIKRVSLDGIANVVAPAVNPRGLAWLDNETIVFTPEPRSGLLTVAASGGTPKPLTTIDSAANERSHRWPTVLPGGKAVLFTIGDLSSPDSYDQSKAGILDMTTGKRHTVIDGAAFVRYANGYLVFGRGGSIYAVRFDVNRLETVGTPVVVHKGVAVDANTGATHFSIAADGTLAYVPGNPTPNLRRLIWVTPGGVAEPIDVPPAVFNDPRISPDGTRVAVMVGPIGGGDIWVYGLHDSTRTRLTFDGHSVTPFWSSDSRSVYYSSLDAPNRKTTIFRRAADGSRDPESVGSTSLRAYLGGIERSGLASVVSLGQWGGFFDLARVAFGSPMAINNLVATPANEYVASLSPNDRWLAYVSSESGPNEIYAIELTGARRRIPISSGGGEEPHWSADGSELYYRKDDRMMAVSLKPGPDLVVGKSTLLFTGVYNLQSETGFSYDVDAKTKRFLMIRLADDRANAPITSLRVAVNWLEGVTK